MTTPLRDDYDASRLRAEARKTKDAGQARRLLALAVAMVLAHRPHRLPFNMGWWGFTFPLGVFILATNALGAQTGLLAFIIAGHVLTWIFLTLWSVVAVRTLRGAYHGSLFAAPYVSPRAAMRF